MRLNVIEQGVSADRLQQKLLVIISHLDVVLSARDIIKVTASLLMILVSFL